MKHGTLTGYSKYRCQCEPCREAWRRFQRDYGRDVRAGEYRMVDARETRSYINLLIASGMTSSAICAAAGTGKKTTSGIRTGRLKRIKRSTAGRILAVTIDNVDRRAAAPASYAQDLIGELRAAGVTYHDLERVAHISAPQRIANQRHVRPKTLAKLLCVYTYLARRGQVPTHLLDRVTS